MTAKTTVIRHSVMVVTSSLLAGMLLAGCTSLIPQPPTVQPNVPTPTISSFFLDSPTAIAGASTALPTQAQARPTAATRPSPSPIASAATRTTDQIATLILYDDVLNTDWSAERSNQVKYDIASPKATHGGKQAIAVTPTNDFGRIFLTVRKDARKIYPRDRVLGISFWLSGGENTIGTGDLAVTVTGSNQYAYWVADDTSVKVDTPVTAVSPLFPETRLNFLHINRSIPPHSWVEVVVWLDDLVDDPDYTYVTGMYIKNDAGFLDTYYIDDIQIVVKKET
jgi:hypothetical protein